MDIPETVNVLGIPYSVARGGVEPVAASRGAVTLRPHPVPRRRPASRPRERPGTGHPYDRGRVATAQP